MATLEQKEELIEVLKFTPRTYTVEITGYGGEMVMGKVSRATIDYFKENRINLEQYATSWSEPGDDDYVEVPEELQPFTMGSWYDCDNIEHCFGAEFGGSQITVYDEKGDVVWQQDLGHDIEDLGCEVECFCSEDVSEHCTDDTGVFVGQTFDKGRFFEAEFEIREPFDPSKFKFVYFELADWPIVNTVEYDGEELDGSDGVDTTGKSSYFSFQYYDDENNIVEYTSSDEDNDE